MDNKIIKDMLDVFARTIDDSITELSFRFEDEEYFMTVKVLNAGHQFLMRNYTGIGAGPAFHLFFVDESGKHWSIQSRYHGGYLYEDGVLGDKFLPPSKNLPDVEPKAVIAHLERKGVKTVVDCLTGECSASGLLGSMKAGFDEFKEKTGRPMTYSEMREAYG